MSAITAPFRFIGRVLLWVFLLPVGIWRSVVNRRKKEQRGREKFDRKQQERQFKHEKEMAKTQAPQKSPPPPGPPEDE